MAETTDQLDSKDKKYTTQKYGGEPYREPWWFPELPQRKRRYEAFAKGLDGFGYLSAEYETEADVGAKQMLGTVCQLLIIMYQVNPSCTLSEAAEWIKDSLEEVESDRTIKHE